MRKRQSSTVLTCSATSNILGFMIDLLPDLAKLSPQQRLELIEWLWDSLEDKDIPVTAAQRAELERRIASFDQDREHGITWEELRNELQQRR
jgi:putative addiction module component (TIGR02574 family)